MPRIFNMSWDQRRSWMVRKWIVMIMVFVIGIAGVVLIATPAVASAKMNFFGKDMDDINQDMTNALGLGDDKDNPTTKASEIMSGEATYGSQEENGETMQAANELLGGDSSVWNQFFWDSGTKGTQPIVTQISDAMAVFGGMLCFLYFLKAIVDEMSKGTADFDSWLKIFVKLSIAALIIANLNALCNIAQGLAVVFGNIIHTQMEPVKQEAYNEAHGVITQSSSGSTIVKVFKAVTQILSFNVLKILGAYLAAQLMNFLLYVFSFGLFFEIAIRRCFMPIAVANLFSDEGFRGSGARYIKKYFSTCLRIAMLVLITEMAQIASWRIMIANGKIEGNGSALANIPLVSMLVVTFAAYGVYGKASSFADDIVGVT